MNPICAHPPSISVIMAVYDGETYLRQSINSILNQSLEDFEFIIVDDGSKDKSLNIIMDYDDPRIRILINEGNMGLSYSLNRGVSVSKCELIARQDADDISLPNRLERLSEIISSDPKLGVVASSAEWTNSHSDEQKIWPRGMDNDEIQQLLLKTCPIIHGSTLIRKRAFVEVGGYAERLSRAQDYDLWLRIAETWDLLCSSEILYQYRQHEMMASRLYGRDQSQSARLSLEFALKRRKRLIRDVCFNDQSPIARMTRERGKHWLARRYVWWALGVRSFNRMYTVLFLLLAMLLSPRSPELWEYVIHYTRRHLTGHRSE